MTWFLRRPPRDNSRHPGSRRRRHIHDVLATRSQPLREMTAEPRAFSTAHRRSQNWPCPSQQQPVARQRCVDLQRPLGLVSRSIDSVRCVRRLVRINSDDDHPRDAFHPAGQQRRAVDDTPTSSSGQTISPLLSQTTAWRRPARQTPGDPARRRRRFTSLAGHQHHEMLDQRRRTRPARLIQVDDSLQLGL
jgi:hypothetical protein